MSQRAGIYCRISQDREGAGLGVERQSEDCRALAEQLGWTVVDTYTDNDLSAYSGKARPDYERLLADIEAGKVTAVIAWHADRLHRSTVELERYIAVCESRNVPTHTVRAGELDLTTASGRMVARVTGAVARHESEQKSERIKRAMRQKAERGEFRGGPRPYGFEADGVQQREDEAALLRKITAQVLAGESLYAVTQALNRAGLTSPRGKRWSEPNLRTLLLRPRNAGLIGGKDGRILGTAGWHPIIDPDEWHVLVTILREPSRAPWNGGGRTVKMLGAGLFLCGACGATVVSGGTTGSNGVSRYRCSRFDLHRTAPPVDEYVLDTIAELLRRRGDRLVAPTPDVAPLRARLTRLEQKRQEIASEFGDPDSDMTREQFRVANEPLGAAILELERRLASLVRPSALDGIADADDPGAAFLDAGMERQRVVIRAVAEVTLARAPRGRWFDVSTVSVVERRP
jgi:DNA invertase Pin-like site-specific DNA recombinase